jgi:peptidoglycan/LPS O-acetylase OafA/YrhL
MAAGAGFISNIVLLGEAGYFDNAAETKPLLHLWSLGIEEQFYIVWPLLLWFAWRRKFNLLTMTIFFTIISFVLNFKGVRQDAIATFYSPQTRFWELLCGSLLAWLMLYQRQKLSHIANNIDDFLVAVLYTEKQKIQRQTLANCSSLLGLLLVTYGLLHINKELRFPGEWALIPVTGAVLLLAAGPDAVVNRKILSARLLVWFGLISFPLYLWHWPLLSFARIVESEVPSSEIRLQAAVLSIVLAWLTYLLIERPMRFGKYGRAKIITLVFLMIVIGYVGFNTYQRDGLKFRLLSSKAQIGNINSADLLNESINNCLAYFPDWDKVTDNPCRFKEKPRIPSQLLAIPMPVICMLD